MKNKLTDSPKLPEFISANLANFDSTREEQDPFRRLIFAWLDSGKAAGLAPKTTFDYHEKVFKFWWWWAVHTRYSDKLGNHPKFVTFEEAEQYVVYLRTPCSNRWGVTGHMRQTEALSPSSISSYGRAVKVFFAWLKRRRYIQENPFSEVSFATRKQSRVLKTIPPQSLSKIFEYISAKDKVDKFIGARNLAIMALLLDSGIRKGELLSIRLKHLDLDNCRVEVEGKTGKRMVVFGETCRKALANYLYFLIEPKPDDPLWQTEGGTGLLETGLATVIRTIRLKVGIHFHAHQLRHTFATHLAAQGVNIQDIKNALGHESVTTTEIYLSASVERQTEVHRQTSPLNQLAGTGVSNIRRRGRPRK